MTGREDGSGWEGATRLALCALGIVAAAKLATMAGLGWLVPTSLGLALYNRVHKEGSFDNATRRRIFDQVRDQPGQSIAEIATTVGVSHSTASYHLERLIQFNLLAATQDGNKVRFFVNGGTFTEEERRVLAALSNAETRRVLATVIAHPGCYRAELTTELGVSSPTVNWHLARLLAAELVREERRGRNRYLFADTARLQGLFATLAAKVEGTRYDAGGIVEILRMCGSA